MDEKLRNEIVQRYQAGTSMRRIARELQVARTTVRRVLGRLQRERSGATPASELRKPSTRPSVLDKHDAVIRQLLERYPNMTAVRVHEELHARGVCTSYTIVRERVRLLRPQPTKEPVVRFETAPGAQAQMDYSTYDIDFTEGGRRRVYLFSYVLSFSRRAYMRFVETQDFATTIREHVRAFDYLGGCAATCLYDNMKVVVLRHDEDGPLYHPRFLAFATHYGFQPWACLPRRARTKGKAERRFDFVEKNLLNGRTFCNLAHLNDVSAWWLTHVADVRLHRETRQRPIDRYAAERPHLIPLPLAGFDWEFNSKTINRVQIEELATAAFVGRHDNLVIVGQSGVGKSRIIEAVGQAACVLGYRVRYTTSAGLLTDLTASLADQTLPERVRYYARFDLLIVDEFAFDKIERSETPQAANLLYKIIDARTRRSTALVTNIDFDAWGKYLDDPPLAMAFLDRVVDGAIIIKINGKSYRAHRARTKTTPPPAM